MRYEAKGIESRSERVTHYTTSYHCNFAGCSVRYTPTDGYFTVIDMPDLPHFVEEPGANLLQCPRHGTWLFRGARKGGTKLFLWKCGVEGCDYQRGDVESAGLSH
jgi:hypothetical protein